MDKFTADGPKVKALRKEKKLKQSAFNNVSDAIVRQMENGVAVSLKKAIIVANALGTDISDIEAGRGEAPTSEIGNDKPNEVGMVDLRHNAEAENLEDDDPGYAWPATEVMSALREGVNHKLPRKFHIPTSLLEQSTMDDEGGFVQPIMFMKRVDAAFDKLSRVDYLFKPHHIRATSLNDLETQVENLNLENEVLQDLSWCVRFLQRAFDIYTYYAEVSNLDYEEQFAHDLESWEELRVHDSAYLIFTGKRYKYLRCLCSEPPGEALVDPFEILEAGER